jgi:hypothetical protein
MKTIKKLISGKEAPARKRGASGATAKRQVVTVRLRINRKSTPLLVKVWKGAGAMVLAQGPKEVYKGPNLCWIHLLLERRWLGLGEKAQRSSLGRRSVACSSVVEGWGIRVRAAYRNKAHAEKALDAALKNQTEVERDGSLRERAQLMVKSFAVQGQDRGNSDLEIGRRACVNGTVTRKIYTVTSSVGETFSNQDLPPGLVEFSGNYFYMSEHDAEEASKSEELRGTPWGYPHNARRPGDILKLFSSPVAEGGANAYATGLALKDVQIPGCMSLDTCDLEKAVTYSKEGLAQVRLQSSAARGSIVRVLISVREHTIQDFRPRGRLPATPLRGQRKRTAVSSAQSCEN